MAAAPAENPSAFGRGEAAETAPLRGETAQTAPVRREERVAGVCVVEYARFPRLLGLGGERVGFTRDVSRRGLCIGVDEPEPVGALVRFRLRGADSGRGPIRVARVAWCGPTCDERHWLGLECLAGTRPHSVRQAI